VLAKAERILTDLVLMRSTSEDDVGPIVDHVSQKLKKLGLELRYHGVKERPAIVAQHKTGGVLLSGHLDTVPSGTGWTHAPAEVVGGVMYGRGTCDMKGGCAAMLLAAEKLVLADVPFSLLFTTDEETTMEGAKDAAKDRAVASSPAVLITEPSNFDIVVKEKGLLQFSIATKGKAAHASMPHLGDNAITRMVDIIHRLGDLQAIPSDPTSQMTLCVNTINGGTRINVIPDECKVEIDVRYPPNMDLQSVLGLVRNRLGDDSYQLDVLHALDPVETDPAAHPVRALKDVLGEGARVISVPYATEMVMLKPSNPIVIVCGPGDPQGCHIVDEKIELAQVVKAAEVYSEFCSRIAKD